MTDGRALVEAALRLKPDLIILDITMPLLNGIDAAVQIKKSLPGDEAAVHHDARQPCVPGSRTQRGRDRIRPEIRRARRTSGALSRCVLSGRIYVTPSLSREHLERFENPSLAAATLRLTAREREILQLIAEGRAAKEMAYVLNISVKTVAFHRENIKRKLGLRTTAELTKHAIEQRLI